MLCVATKCCHFYFKRFFKNTFHNFAKHLVIYKLVPYNSFGCMPTFFLLTDSKMNACFAQHELWGTIEVVPYQRDAISSITDCTILGKTGKKVKTFKRMGSIVTQIDPTSSSLQFVQRNTVCSKI
ncbi:hypothetical protein XELAEV_18039622mg [Xenopus laevis]|uniref:Uncharacterized protein n=1 Tax=Xenopus laevis TaxID=8355 RepID=A0A974C864_XENLA|nr:hypothetical protein XELAEV_18039622mg [Xenopus laevis]